MCKYNRDEFCVNDECPCCTDYCPVADIYEEICKFYELPIDKDSDSNTEDY